MPYPHTWTAKSNGDSHEQESAVMPANGLLRDAYRELDETGSLSHTTQRNLDAAGIDPLVLIAASLPHLED